MNTPSKITRRRALQSLTATAFASALMNPLAVLHAADAGKATVIDIGSRRELFVDDFLIERMTDAALKLHKPEPHDVVLVCDAPWEGNTCAYFTFFRDDDRFRAYYRGLHYRKSSQHSQPPVTKGVGGQLLTKGELAHPQVTCYAESKDGNTWTKPQLGLREFSGSKDNNIVWATTPVSHNFTPFKDGNPACAPDARYKALAIDTTTLNGKKKDCLNAFKSPDGIHWMLLQEAVITTGSFDSQNLAFWDSARGEYRAYWRSGAPTGERGVRTATSKDFIRWENQADLKYGDSPPEHLYTNAVMPYFRAPHLFIGFPTRFDPKTEQVEPVFMTSRDGVRFRRWAEELIPITAPKDRDGNRSNYMTWGLLQLPGNDRELSVYATEANLRVATRVRRFTFRIDGFVSVHAAGKGELLTKPLHFAGRTLELNCRTAAQGSINVEIQDADGKPLPGFALADSQPMSGDEIVHHVNWKGGSDVSALAGKPVRLRFMLRDADLYSFRFADKKLQP